MDDDQPETLEIRSLLVPLADYNLLVPGSMVAEVVPYQEGEPASVTADGEGWVRGVVEWRGLRVPLISMEAYSGDRMMTPGARARLLIVKGLSQRSGLRFYALIAQQIPRLTTVSEGILEGLNDPAYERVPGEGVLVGGEPAVIPDVEALEGRLHAALETA